MISERRLDVLRAIVAEYVRTREPVGSKAIATGHDLGVSSATIRNDMAALEDSGLIYQPHTSAGRVPTDKGYRLFVDQLSVLKPMTIPEARAVESFLDGCVVLDDVVQRTVRLLAQATHQVAVVQYPLAASVKLRRVEVVDITPRRLLVVVIADNGVVEERFIELPQPVEADTISTLNQRLNAELQGKTSQEIRDLDTIQLPESAVSPSAGALPASTVLPAATIDAMMSLIAELLTAQSETKLAVAGLSNLARSGVDFHDVVPVLDALEEQVVLLRLFAEQHDNDDDIHITIGAENRHDVLTETSVITGHYASSGTVANIGIVGPTRMDYARTISTVKAVASYLSRHFNHSA